MSSYLEQYMPSYLEQMPVIAVDKLVDMPGRCGQSELYERSGGKKP